MDNYSQITERIIEAGEDNGIYINNSMAEYSLNKYIAVEGEDKIDKNITNEDLWSEIKDYLV